MSPDVDLLEIGMLIQETCHQLSFSMGSMLQVE